MEKRFQSLSLFEFQTRFPDDDTCMSYLADLKWKKQGYACKKCGNEHYCNGLDKYDRQCTKCNYIESPRAGTLFHKSKFSVLKAFYIVYYMATTKNGISTTELSRKLNLRQKTCWLFKRKVMRAMKSSGDHPLDGEVEVDETYVGGQDDQAIGRNEGKKRIVVVAIQRKGHGISRMYGRVIPTASRENLKHFMVDHIQSDAKVKTDKWTGYKGLNEVFVNLRQEKSEKKGRNFPQLHRGIMMFKAWLRGTHHSVSHLQAYIDEYTYRFNRHYMKEAIFDNLMNRMMQTDPHPYKMFIK